MLCELNSLKKTEHLNDSCSINSDELTNFSFIKTLQTEAELQKRYFDQQLELLRTNLETQISNIRPNMESEREINSLREQFNFLLTENTTTNERLTKTETLME